MGPRMTYFMCGRQVLTYSILGFVYSSVNCTAEMTRVGWSMAGSSSADAEAANKDTSTAISPVSFGTLIFSFMATLLDRAVAARMPPLPPQQVARFPARAEARAGLSDRQVRRTKAEPRETRPAR